MAIVDTSTKTMYKRPIPRARGFAPRQFVSEAQPGGGVRSQWVTQTSHTLVPSGTPGVVGELIDKMRNPHSACVLKQYEWTPPREYEFIAERMSEAERGPWLQKCRAWFDARPKPIVPPPPPASTIDHQLIAAMYDMGRRVTRPPIAKRVKVYREAGVSDAYIAKAIARDARLEATSDERQKALDLIFAKWPSASKTVKPKAKAKPKVIKAVKKKL